MTVERHVASNATLCDPPVFLSKRENRLACTAFAIVQLARYDLVAGAAPGATGARLQLAYGSLRRKLVSPEGCPQLCRTLLRADLFAVCSAAQGLPTRLKNALGSGSPRRGRPGRACCATAEPAVFIWARFVARERRMQREAILTVVGARPQFIKAAAVSRAIGASADFREIMIHTGQHFDEKMSDVFFRELEIPAPHENFDIHGGYHGFMTGRMLEAIEGAILKYKPAWVLIYGDTNSTLAGALAAAKLNVRVIHVEAGLRSFNRRMPEEINRVVADHVSTLLLCPTQTAVDNLAKEGIVKGVHHVGDVMFDAMLHAKAVALKTSHIIRELNVSEGAFVLATIHRADNTDDRDLWRASSMPSNARPRAGRWCFRCIRVRGRQ